MAEDKLKAYMEAEGYESIALVGFRADGTVVVEADATVDEILRASAFLVRSTMDAMPPHVVNPQEVPN